MRPDTIVARAPTMPMAHSHRDALLDSSSALRLTSSRSAPTRRAPRSSTCPWGDTDHTLAVEIEVRIGDEAELPKLSNHSLERGPGNDALAQRPAPVDYSVEGLGKVTGKF